MKYKVGDKVILKGTKSASGNNFNEYFKDRKKGDIVTIHYISKDKGYIYVIKKEFPNETNGALKECDISFLNWKDRFTQ